MADRDETKYPYHQLRESSPQLQLAVLIFKEGSWGVIGKPANKKNVRAFFDDVIAICAAESSFNPKAVNGNAKGLFQIMVTVHEDKIGGRDIFDPLVNINVAGKVAREAHKAGKDPFSPWEAYTKKTPAYLKNKGWGADAYDYLLLLEEAELGKAYAKALAAFMPGGPLITAAASVPAVDSIGKALAFIKEAGNVIGVFAIGLVLLVLGIWYLASQTSVGKAAGNVIPAGKIAKLVK